MRRLLVDALALVGALAMLVGLGFVSRGVSARSAPSALEAWVARRGRDLLIPTSQKAPANPLASSPALLTRAGRHFREHCSPCHGTDGRGDTALGRGLHPRVPDLTLPATQDLSDGTLFWIIENGVRLTGMPAFGTASPEDDEHGWSLVHWIRHLPELGPEDIEALELEDAPNSRPSSHHDPHVHGHHP